MITTTCRIRWIPLSGPVYRTVGEPPPLSRCCSLGSRACAATFNPHDDAASASTATMTRGGRGPRRISSMVRPRGGGGFWIPVLTGEGLGRDPGPPGLPARLRERPDGVVVGIAPLERVGIVELDARPVVLGPVRDPELPVVVIHLMYPPLADERHVAHDAGGGEPRKVAHDRPLQLLRLVHGDPPVFGVGDHVAHVEVVRHDLGPVEEREAKLQ